MTTIMTALNGKKTYIVAFLTAVSAGAEALGYHIPDYVWTLLAAAGLGSVRHSIASA